MADANPTEFMSAKEAAALADSLSRYGGKYSLTTRLARMESQCRKASRLIRAMLRQVHSSDVFRCRRKSDCLAAPASFPAPTHSAGQMDARALPRMTFRNRMTFRREPRKSHAQNCRVATDQLRRFPVGINEPSRRLPARIGAFCDADDVTRSFDQRGPLRRAR